MFDLSEVTLKPWYLQPLPLDAKKLEDLKTIVNVELLPQADVQFFGTPSLLSVMKPREPQKTQMTPCSLRTTLLYIRLKVNIIFSFLILSFHSKYEHVLLQVLNSDENVISDEWY